jgi:hypothetical protein
MQKPRVVIRQRHEQTRLLLMHDGQELLKAVLPYRPAHRRAAQAVLEGLALWLGRPVSVVLYVDGSANSSALDLCDVLGFGVETLHFDVEVVHPRNIGLGSFRDLREIATDDGGEK